MMDSLTHISKCVYDRVFAYRYLLLLYVKYLQLRKFIKFIQSYMKTNSKVLPQNFPERIGYACLNTILRKQTPTVFCSRTCRMSTVLGKESILQGSGIDYLKSLGRQNVQDLLKMILWNEENGISFMRMSSDMFPFASHENLGYTLDYCKEDLEKVGELAKKLGHRLTTHPGQTNNLGSPHRSVILSTQRDLIYHASMMDLMKLPRDSVMIIHGGGTYNNKEETLKRFKIEFLLLPENVQKRIVLENDEICYNAEELLPLCEELEIPLVFDWHHHNLNPGTLKLDVILSRIRNIWDKRGIRQKMHYSESRTGVSITSSVAERRAHSDYVKDIKSYASDCDLMIEAKMKEQAVFAIYEKYGIPVDPAVLATEE